MQYVGENLHWPMSNEKNASSITNDANGNAHKWKLFLWVHRS